MAGIPERLIKARWFPAAVALAVVSAVVVLFCWPILFDGRTIFHTHGGWPPTDETSVHFPLQIEINRQNSKGDFATYSQWTAFGQPLISDPNALLFDPFMALFRGCGSVSEVYTARAIALGTVAAFAVFGFLWLLGGSVIGSGVGAAVFLSLVLRYPTAEEVLLHYAGTDWSVIGLCLLALAVRGRRSWAFPLAGLSTGIAGLSGHPQTFYFGVAMGALYVFGEAWPRRGNDWKYVLKGGAGWLLISLATASVQLVPLFSQMASSSHVFSDPTHPEFDENLIGYVITLLGPGLAMFLLLPTRRRWIESGVFVLMVLFCLTVANTPIVKFWHVAVPFFEFFKLSSKYFVSPFPVLAAVGLGLAVDFVARWKGKAGRIGLFVCGICALWPVWGAPFGTIYQLQQPSSHVEAVDKECLHDIRRNTPPFGRIVRFDTEAFYPSLSTTSGIFDAQAASSHISVRYSDLMQRLNPKHADIIREDSRVMSFTEPDVLKLAFWDVAGVTTLISGKPVDIPGWELVLSRPDATCVTDSPGYWIYRNVEAFSRAYLVQDADTPDGLRYGLDFVASPETQAPVIAPGKVTIREYEGARVVLDVDSETDAFLVLSDSWSGWWKATLNGSPVTIDRTWYIFRAVSVPPGHSVVEMVFRPAPFVAGIAVTAVGLFSALIWLLLAVWKQCLCKRKSGVSVSN